MKTKKILCLFMILFIAFAICINDVKAESKITYKNNNFDNYIVKKDTETDEDGIPKLDLGDLTNGNKKQYTVDCDDWEDFHTIWDIIKLLGPFAYIIFAAFDFFKIVMAGDEESIKKAKKRIPSRLIIFILFILIPFLVQFIAGNFGSNNANNLKIFKCVVNGRL